MKSHAVSDRAAVMPCQETVLQRGEGPLRRKPRAPLAEDSRGEVAQTEHCRDLPGREGTVREPR